MWSPMPENMQIKFDLEDAPFPKAQETLRLGPKGGFVCQATIKNVIQLFKNA